ncbi:hypothetical protein DVH05_016281 [Phytophthora capsici]|nr:hypothetical protein DVH05_017862 [Phytophthora capsici]KAG1683339.1 hypothetical protein DVH05_015582 [Phytophthora capsici]KAG1697406.1 hypothetical protein DVH05_016281 [Phytophthora capsici]
MESDLSRLPYEESDLSRLPYHMVEVGRWTRDRTGLVSVTADPEDLDLAEGQDPGPPGSPGRSGSSWKLRSVVNPDPSEGDPVKGVYQTGEDFYDSVKAAFDEELHAWENL